MKTEQLIVNTRGRGCYELTGLIQQLVTGWEISSGLCHVFIRHTSASLIVCENADPAVLRDLERFMARLVPDGDALFKHVQEGPDDMPAHVRSVLTRTDMTVPVVDGRLDLGTWQGIYLWEHRVAAHQRTVRVSLLGGG